MKSKISKFYFCKFDSTESIDINDPQYKVLCKKEMEIMEQIKRSV